MNDLPILDTEEKLRAYLNEIAGHEVDPLTIKASVYPDRVHLDTNRDPGIHIAFAQTSQNWMTVQSYGMVDRAVLPVLKELHARHDKEIQASIKKRWEESCQREEEKADRQAKYRQQEIDRQQRELEKNKPSILTRILNLVK